MMPVTSYFKRYNDHFGHPAGDQVLRALTRQADQALYQAKKSRRNRWEVFRETPENTPH